MYILYTIANKKTEINDLQSLGWWWGLPRLGDLAFGCQSDCQCLGLHQPSYLVLFQYVCGNDICRAGESCQMYPLDCASATISLVACGNGVCEAGDGENFLNWPYDCHGDTAASHYCGSGYSCETESCCNQRSFRCTSLTSGSVSTCCSDGVCTWGKSSKTCNLYCKAWKTWDFSACNNAIATANAKYQDCVLGLEWVSNW
jgi:hypothetical protein